MDTCGIYRLGLAYCRLNTWEWDEIVGPKPDGFDALPCYDKYDHIRIRHSILMRILEKLNPKKYAKRRTKHDYVRPAMGAIKSIIGEDNCSRSWWAYELGKPQDEWLRWYFSHYGQ